jgi:PAS domain S-box-containing protein
LPAVLVVGADDPIYDDIEMILAPNFELSAVKTLADAPELLGGGNFDLVLVDPSCEADLAGLAGLAMAAPSALRLLLEAFPQPSSRAARAGGGLIDGFVEGPLSLENLAAALAPLLEKRQTALLALRTRLGIEDEGGSFPPRPATGDAAYLDSMAEGYQVIDREWRYVYLNDAAVHQARKPRKELIGRTMMAAYPGIEDTAMFANLRRCMTEGLSIEMENEFDYGEGHRGWFKLAARPVAAGISVLSYDISATRVREEASRARRMALEEEVASRTAEMESQRLLLESILESLPGILVIRDEEGRTILTNQGMEKVTGFSTEELKSLASGSVGALTKAENGAALRADLELKGLASFEATIRTKKGELLPFIFSASENRREGRKLTLVLGIDGTKQKESERRLIEEREFVESLIQNLPGLFVIRDFDLKLLKWNRNLETLTGYTAEELHALDGRALTEASSGQGTAAILKSVMEGRDVALEVMFRTKTGTSIPHHVHILKIDYFGKPAIMNIGFDISQQKRAFLAVEASEKKTRLLGEIASAANAAASTGEVLGAALRTIIAFTSFPLGHVYFPETGAEGRVELVSSDIWEAEDPSRFASFMALTARTVLSVGEPLAGQVFSTRRPSWIRDVAVAPGYKRAKAAAEAGIRTAIGFPVMAHDEVMAVLEFLSVEAEESTDEIEAFFDLVEVQIRTAIERLAAEESLKRLSAVVDQNPIAVLITDMGGRIVYANPQMSRQTGFAREELVGSSTSMIRERIHEQGLLEEVTAKVRAGDRWTGELESTRKDGSPYWEKVVVIPIKDGAGRVTSIVSLREDVTERRHREEEIRDSETSSRLIKLVAMAANEATNIDDILGVAIRNIADYALWPLAHVYLARRLADGSIGLLPSEIWHRREGKDFEAFRRATAGTVLRPGVGLVGTVYESREARWIDSLERDESLLRREGALADGLVSGLVLPVLVGEAVFALLEFYSTEVMRRTPRLMNHISQITYSLQVAIARINAEEKIKRLSEIIEQGPSGVVTLDKTGTIEYVNSRFLEMTGYAAEELLGQKGDILGDSIEDQGLVREINAALFEGRIWKGETANRRKGGGSFWERLSIFPVLDENRQFLSFVTLADDVTELKRIEIQLDEARIEAERANMAKTDFLAAMSHEIRTPMNAVIGLTNLALKTSLEPRQRDYLVKIRRSSQLLLDIINDILDFSKIEAGKIEIESLAFDLELSLQSLWTIVSLRAAEKDIEIVLKLAEDLPPKLVGDPHRLGQILLNLLNNAVKFTERGEVILSITVLERTESRGRLRFAVADTGIGMSEDQVERLFRPYSQAEGGTSRKFGGSGLGLVISMRLATLMEGAMSVTSSPGKGSVFSVDLPFGFVEGEGTGRALGKDWRRLRILVVDDNAEAREHLASLLSGFAFDVTTAASGDEALSLLAREAAPLPFDLLLLDTRMGGLSCAETLGRLREIGDLEGLRVLLMGYEPEKEGLAEDMARYGVAGFLAKPVSPSILLDSIMGLLSGGLSAGWAAPAEGGGLKPDWSELGGATVLLAEDNEINQQVAGELLASVGIGFDIAADGFEVLDRLAERSYDAILMDLQMPRMDGIAATAQIRADPELSDNLVIAMTADVFAVNSEPFKDSGFDGFVFKPVDEAELFRSLAALLAKRRAAGRPRVADAAMRGPGPGRPAGAPRPKGGGAATTRFATELPALPGIDAAGGLARVLGNGALYRNLLFSFADSQAGTAGEIEAALGKGDLEAARVLAHGLKGVAANLGAREEGRLLGELEGALRTREAAKAVAIAGRIAELHRGSVAAIRAWRSRLEEEPPAASEDREKAPPGGKAAYPASACPDLERLISKLEGSDAAAQGAYAELRAGLVQRGGRIVTGLEQLKKQMDRYDYENALQSATELEAALGCAATD